MRLSALRSWLVAWADELAGGGQSRQVSDVAGHVDGVADEELAGRGVAQRLARLPTEGELDGGGGEVAIQRRGEVAPSGEAWVDLDEAVFGFRAVGFDELKLERSVPAKLSDERLRGWVSSYFGESKPDSLRTRRYIRVNVERNGQTLGYVVEDDGTMEGEPYPLGQSVTEWSMADGELRSERRNDFFGGEIPSWLSYQRPLRDGETVRYECWSQPGVTTTQPTFGETAYKFGLPPQTEGQANGQTTASGSLAHRTCEADFQSGWNSVALSLRGDLFVMELNGKEVVSENIEPTHSRRFGFFHDAATSNLRVRNVVLSGDWPKKFDAATRAALEMPQPV